MNSSFYNRQDQLIGVSIKLMDNMLKGGPFALKNFIDNEFVKLPDPIYSVYKNCLYMVIEGKNPEQLKLLMEFEKISWICDRTSKDDLKIIAIIQSLIPIIQEYDISSFIDIIYCLLPKRKADEISDNTNFIKEYIEETYNQK
ncbi:hypothetical protein [Clostridium tagluense]|uniref:hypothetical protein n=1 Tax=Clostridium tagluense TaxID=360422 RepID=UPI001C6F015D|nr:hypothetical protein [Clostridium tagluense]MBW9159478.1 hypothetical protein [Clostridium tagluense]WLC68486.1 hypothetical protein KTC93_25570 [Clostridium tagluense]